MRALNEKIARALAEDIRRRGGNGRTLEFHDDEAVYVVSVRVEKASNKTLRESRGYVLKMSGSAPGDPCTCCGGTGRV
jgi:hypothetical protein